MEPGTRVRALKEQLQEKEGIDVAQIRLVFSGAQLCVSDPPSALLPAARLPRRTDIAPPISHQPRSADDRTLEESKVEPGGTIHMVLSLRGGGRA